MIVDITIMGDALKKKLKITLLLFILLLIGFAFPQNFSMPVEGATLSDYNQASFWFHPWGRSGTHKGVDIFATKGTPLNSSVTGIVLYTGTVEMGGNVVIVLGPKWRLHYFAHLETTTTSIGWIARDRQIGTVGDSGNAKGKPAHLHYSIVTLVPYPWRIDADPQGWKKMFFVDPLPFLNAS